MTHPNSERDLPHLRQPSRFDGIPDKTPAELEWEARKRAEQEPAGESA